jgi:trimeric autotransporter adhesin
LNSPRGVALDASENLYIADTGNNLVRLVTKSDGTITTVVGSPFVFYANGQVGDGYPATMANLNTPTSVAIDGSGNLYIADSNNQRVRKVNSAGIMSTIAGTGVYGFSGDGAASTSAQLWNPQGVAVDVSGSIFIADTSNHRIRLINSAGIISTYAGTGASDFSGDSASATSAGLSYPSGVTVDASGNLYIADYNNNRIRKVIRSTGTIVSYAGSGSPGSTNGGFSGDGGPPTSAMLKAPQSVAVDASGNVYIADTFNQRIRLISTTVKPTAAPVTPVTSVTPVTVTVPRPPSGRGKRLRLRASFNTDMQVQL